MPRRPSVDQVEAQALEAAAGLRSAGAKLVCIDFDATFVSVHTGGLWTRSAAALSAYTRRFFVLLVPLLLEARVAVAIVTFSPQVELIQEVLRLSFPADVVEQLVVRGDDKNWSLSHEQTADFLPLWQADGRHLDRHYKLPFMISAALQVGEARGSPVCNRDTVLIDDDAVNIRVANDSGVIGVFFDPEEQDAEPFCKRIRKLLAREPQTLPAPLRTPSKKPRDVKLVAKSEGKFLSARGGAKRRLGAPPGSGGRASTFNMCTPSPVMKLKCSVDMGRPRSKRTSRFLRNYSKEIEAALPAVAENPKESVASAPCSSPPQPTSMREASDARGLSTPTV